MLEATPLAELSDGLESLMVTAGTADDHALVRRAQFDLGLAWVHFPRGLGGLAMDPDHQQEIDARLGDVGIGLALFDNPMGVGMVAPTLVAHGSEEQQRRFLRSIFTAEEIWCQLFSEPGAGSDVANCATRAVRHGDVWIVDGQKVWTSLGHLARFGLLIARTDPDVPKHKGLTCFLVDMHAPGVEVRPLRQMTGDAEFNEVFLEGVRVDDGMRVGAVGDGWRVVLTTLMNERVAIGGQTPLRGSGPIADALDCWRKRGARHDPLARERLTKLWIEAELIRLTNIRAQERREKGDPGPEGSIGKLSLCEFNQRCYSFCVDVLGPEGVLYPSGYASRERRPTDLGSDPPRAFLRSRANSIEGGTSEIMRNILAERVLGLPGDVRVDREVAWRDIPRN